MDGQGPASDPELDQMAAEDELLARVKEVARRIMERVRKATEDTAPNPAHKPDEPTGELPAVG